MVVTNKSRNPRVRPAFHHFSLWMQMIQRADKNQIVANCQIKIWILNSRSRLNEDRFELNWYAFKTDWNSSSKPQQTTLSLVGTIQMAKICFGLKSSLSCKCFQPGMSRTCLKFNLTFSIHKILRNDSVPKRRRKFMHLRIIYNKPRNDWGHSLSLYLCNTKQYIA